MSAIVRPPFNMLGRSENPFPLPAEQAAPVTPAPRPLMILPTTAKPAEPVPETPPPEPVKVAAPARPTHLPEYEEVALLENESGLTTFRITAYRRQVGPFSIGVNFAAFRERASMSAGTCVLTTSIPLGDVDRLCRSLEGNGFYVSGPGTPRDRVEIDPHHVRAYSRDRSVGTFRFGFGNARKVAAELRRIFDLGAAR